MKRHLILSVAALQLIALVGCARQVVREAEFGVVAIPANTNMWPLRFRDKADEIMREHFPNGYEIVREEEVVTGQVTSYDEEEVAGEVEIVKDVVSVGTTERSGTVTTSDTTEYWIHYHRRQPWAQSSTIRLR